MSRGPVGPVSENCPGKDGGATAATPGKMFLFVDLKTLSAVWRIAL